MLVDGRASKMMAREIEIRAGISSAAAEAVVGDLVRGVSARPRAGRGNRVKDVNPVVDEAVRRIRAEVGVEPDVVRFTSRTRARFHVRIPFPEVHASGRGWSDPNVGLRAWTVEIGRRRVELRSWRVPVFVGRHALARWIERSVRREPSTAEIAELLDEVGMTAVTWLRCVTSWRLPLRNYVAGPSPDGGGVVGHLSAMSGRLAGDVFRRVIVPGDDRLENVIGADDWWPAVKVRTFLDSDVMNVDQEDAIDAVRGVVRSARPFLSNDPEVMFAWPDPDGIDGTCFDAFETVADYFAEAVRAGRMHWNFSGPRRNESSCDGPRARCARRSAKRSGRRILWPSRKHPGILERSEAVAAASGKVEEDVPDMSGEDGEGDFGGRDLSEDGSATTETAGDTAPAV